MVGVASGVLLRSAGSIDGVYADSWSEAIFGRHGEHLDHAHHPYAASPTASRTSPACGR
jgi:hypothetical protein